MRAKSRERARVAGLARAACLALCATPLAAQTLGPDFAAEYAVADLGVPPGVPGALGGLSFAPGDPSLLWIGGNANTPTGAIYELALQRDAQYHVTGFTSPASAIAAAPWIDGGLSCGPEGVLFFTAFPVNRLEQIAAGGSAPTKTIDLTPLGVSSSVGALALVPQGFPGAGRIKLASYNASLWYDGALAPDGAGTFDLALAGAPVPVSGGPEGLVYVQAGNPAFAADSVLVCEYADGSIGAYELDANGDPLPATRRTFLSGLNGAQGAVLDPLSGDFFFSTLGAVPRLLLVRGLSPVTTFCTAKSQLVCAPPLVSTAGLPSATAASGFTLTAAPIRGCRTGILLYSSEPSRAGVPFGGIGNGVLCLEPAGLRRAGPMDSGGTSLAHCDGAFTIDMSAFASSSWMATGCHPPAGQFSPAGFLHAIGTSVTAQFWFRDSAVTGQGLSNGVHWTIGP